MSIKTLFGAEKYLSKTSVNELTSSVDNELYVRESLKESNRYIPRCNFEDPKAFAKFGSAEKYYLDSIAHIYNDYPFDGSKKEVLEYHNSSSYLDKYVFEKWYPRFNGYAKFCPGGWGDSLGSSLHNLSNPQTKEYIKIFGTMNTGSIGGYGGANVYDVNTVRSTNLKLDGRTGNTVEFWLKKGSSSTFTQKEVIFDLWNGQSVFHGAGSTYGRFTILLAYDVSLIYPQIYMTYVSGTVSVCTFQNIGGIVDCTDEWNHYAITVKNSGNDLKVKCYRNGELSGSIKTFVGGAINEVTGNMIGYIGAIQTQVDAFEAAQPSGDGWGKLSGSMDEFRYWKVCRNEEEIGRNWFTQVGGGSNSVDGNTSLGCYYKFNEGITQTSSVDLKVIDYSGRLSHGTWIGYNTDGTSMVPGFSHRSTSSAMVEFGSADFEYRDPTIYSFHPDVVNLISEKSLTGSYYDYNNSVCLYHSLPSWVIEEDEEKESYNAKNLTQIIGQYFDTLYLQISSSIGLRDVNYYDNLSGSNRSFPFMTRLLESRGFVTPELFSDASALSQLASRDDKREFEKKLFEIKNLIYQNIYNNLSYLYKTKGTMNSVRNLTRCFGIDDEIVKINLYSNNATYFFDNNYKSVSVKKKCVDFNNVDRFAGTIYQFTASNNPISFSYVSSSGNLLEATGSSMTVETSFVFPKKFSDDSEFYFNTPFISASLFGMHTAKDAVSHDTTWASPDVANFQVFAVRDSLESKSVRFVLTGTSGGYIPLLTSSLFQNVYDNEKWTLAFRIRPEKFDSYNVVSGSYENNYVVSLYGINTILDRVINEFDVSQSIGFNYGAAFLDNSKRLYVGSHYTNFTSSLLNRTDVKVYSSRVWLDYLDNSEIKFHAIDVENFGLSNPYKNLTLPKLCYYGKDIPRIESLALNWDFETVTGSDSNGRFYVDDLSSGSLDTKITGSYGWLSQITKKQHIGRGDFFLSNDQDVVDVEFLYSAKQKIPEVLDHDGMVQILTQDDEIFTKDSRPTSFFFSIEKSMYQTISEEMLNWFATIVDFNNLIGMPVNRYRMEYKDLAKLRQLFFERVSNTPDVEKYIDYYKWFDSSLVKMIQQLVPASADMSDQVENIVESHIFERNKYWTKFPTLEMKHSDPESGFNGINELTYDWNHGHHPLSNIQNENCLHWKQKELRTDSILRTFNYGLDLSRAMILSASKSTFDRKFTTLYKNNVDEMREIRSGVNFNRNKRSPIYLKKSIDKVASYYNILSKSFVVNDCMDDSLLNFKKKYKATVYDNTVNDYCESDLVLPFNVMSASGIDGYNRALGISASIANLHHDFYIDGGDIPMQGPFTEQFVGGNKYRHISVNTSALDTIYSRPEGFKLYKNFANGDISIYSCETSGSGEYTTLVPRAKYTRDGLAKSSVNVRNIGKSNYYSRLNNVYNKLYNYSNVYNVVQTSGRKANNKAFVVSGGFYNLSVLASTTVTGVVDYAKPSRGRHEHVFVERFSAPGGAEVAGDSDGGIGLDIDSGEYSVYNSYNYRNLRVRDALKTLLTRRSGQFGVDSLYGVIYPFMYETSASYQKINRNTHRSIKYVEGDVRSFYTSSEYDNWFIQHAIPSNDSGYYWITSSITGSDIGLFLGYATSSTQINFVSGSMSGSGAGKVYYLGNYAGYGSASFYISFYNGLPMDPYCLNAILSNRNGAYQWPSWKQIRAGETTNARFKRRNNIVEHLEPDVVKIGGSSHNVMKAIRGDIISSYVESPVTTKYKSMEHKLTIENEGITSSIVLQSSYGNSLGTFANNELSNKLNAIKNDKTMYDRLLMQYNTKDKLGGVEEFNYLKYEEGVYPSDSNTFQKKIRTRENFTVNYWNSNRQARHDVSFTNSQGNPTQQSIWPLDSRYNESGHRVTGNYEASGELQNNYTIFFRTGSDWRFNDNFAKNMNVGCLYNRPYMEYDSVPYPNFNTGSKIVAGDNLWTAAQESGRKPFYDSYEEFNNDANIKAKDYSIVPEFRISEHMDFYIDKNGGNFLVDNEGMLTVNGGTYSSSLEDNFYTTYSNSDFMQYFNVVKNDHSDVGNLSEIKLSCKALLKLLPYEGFYPVSRTLQLATLFSQSYGDYVSEAGYTSSYVNTNLTKWRSFLTPFFAPGILYNSIKSGIAVDFPIYSGEGNYPISKQDYLSSSVGSEIWSAWESVLKTNFTKRIPFEGLVEPENYIASQKIWDMEPFFSASLNLYENNDQTRQASYWNGKGSPKYKMAMHNFLAEIPNFFLKDNTLTSFVSKPISKIGGISIDSSKSNKFYGMDIYVSNSSLRSYTDFINRSNLPVYSQYLVTSSFVPRNVLEDVYGIHTQMYSKDSSYGPPWVHNSHLFNSSAFGVVYSYHYGYEPFTPAYFNGFGVVRLLFYPFKGEGTYTLDEIQSHLTSSYIRMPTMREGFASYIRTRSLLEWQTLYSLDKNILEVDITGGQQAIPSGIAPSPIGGWQSTNRVHPSNYSYVLSDAFSNWQQLSSSVNFLGKTDLKKISYKSGFNSNNYAIDMAEDVSDGNSIWVIQPKWETPVFNFKNKQAYNFTYGTGSKGMWHQYGDDCLGKDGVWFGISDLPKQNVFGNATEVDYDPTGSVGSIINRNESVVNLEKENAQVELYVRNPIGLQRLYLNLNGNGICIEGVGDTICGPLILINPSHTPGDPCLSYPRIEYDCDITSTTLSVSSSYSACRVISDFINSDYRTRGYFTASAYNVPNSESPFEHTGAIIFLNDGTGTPKPNRMGIAKVVIRIKNHITGGVGCDIPTGYPNYYAAGALGNDILCSITSSYFPILNVEQYGTYPHANTITDVVCLKGADKFDNKKIVTGTQVKYYGGITRDYKIESLADLVGFQKSEKKIGELSQEKEIREAVLAIPYINKGRNKNFFKISRRFVDSILGKVQLSDKEEKPGESIVNMVNSLRNYVLPPKFDFITYDQIDPFSIYVFEFRNKLTRKDLKDIWQNLSPEAVDRIVEQESVVQHKFSNNELLSSDLGDNVQWLVFKVKQRAAWNYFATTADSSDDNRFKFDFNIGGKESTKTGVPAYNYNYPYDFCSIVDRIKIDAGITIEGKKEEKK